MITTSVRKAGLKLAKRKMGETIFVRGVAPTQNHYHVERQVADLAEGMGTPGFRFWDFIGSFGDAGFTPLKWWVPQTQEWVDFATLQTGADVPRGRVGVSPRVVMGVGFINAMADSQLTIRLPNYPDFPANSFAPGTPGNIAYSVQIGVIAPLVHIAAFNLWIRSLPAGVYGTELLDDWIKPDILNIMGKEISTISAAAGSWEFEYKEKFAYTEALGWNPPWDGSAFVTTVGEWPYPADDADTFR